MIDFKKDVLCSSRPVLVDFYADWCGPCKALSKTLDSIAEDNKVNVVKINVDESSDIANEYGVQSIPTIIIFNKGSIATTIVGTKSKSQIMDEVARYT